MKAVLVSAVITFLPMSAFSYCGEQYQACPTSPVRGACVEGCVENSTLIRAGTLSDDDIPKSAETCVIVPDKTLIRDVGWGIYDVPARISLLRHRKMTYGFNRYGQVQFCISALNYDNFDRELYIRVWLNGREDNFGH